MGHYGAMHMTGNLILPDKKTEFFGMSGIGATDDNDWDAAAQFAKAAREAEAAAMSGIYSDPENPDDIDNPVGAINDTPANTATLVM